MRHKKSVKKLSRSKSHREAMLSNMASSLILNEYIVTTEAKGKRCKSYVDKVISIAKKNDLSSYRKIEKKLKDKLASDKVVKVLSERFKDRIGGFTNLVHLGSRKGDNARLVKVILIGSKPFKEKVKTKKRKVKKQKNVVEKEDQKKKNIFEKVKGIGSKMKKGKSQKDDQVDKGPSDIRVKSRSGI